MSRVSNSLIYVKKEALKEKQYALTLQNVLLHHQHLKHRNDLKQQIDCFYKLFKKLFLYYFI